MSKAVAQLRGRDYVVPSDVREVFVHVVAHRLLLTGRAESMGKTAEQVLRGITETVAAPRLR
jgi:MoxR-like ATPase